VKTITISRRDWLGGMTSRDDVIQALTNAVNRLSLDARELGATPVWPSFRLESGWVDDYTIGGAPHRQATYTEFSVDVELADEEEEELDHR
jgi:hypothetical protein